MNIEWVWLLHYMELRYHWLPEALMECEGHSFTLLAVWWYRWKHRKEPRSCPGLAETRRHYCIIGRLTHILPSYIQAARPHETSCCLDWSRWAMCMRSVVLLPSASQCHRGPWTWGEQALGRGGWSQSLLRCGRAVMRQSFILQTAEQEQPT